MKQINAENLNGGGRNEVMRNRCGYSERQKQRKPLEVCYFLVPIHSTCCWSKAGALSIIEFFGRSPRRRPDGFLRLALPAWVCGFGSQLTLCWLTYECDVCARALSKPQRLTCVVHFSEIINFNGCLQSERATQCSSCWFFFLDVPISVVTKKPTNSWQLEQCMLLPHKKVMNAISPTDY